MVYFIRLEFLYLSRILINLTKINASHWKCICFLSYHNAVKSGINIMRKELDFYCIIKGLWICECKSKHGVFIVNTWRAVIAFKVLLIRNHEAWNGEQRLPRLTYMYLKVFPVGYAIGSRGIILAGKETVCDSRRRRWFLLARTMRALDCQTKTDVQEVLENRLINIVNIHLDFRFSTPIILEKFWHFQ